MARVRFAQIVAVVTLAGSLAACGTSSSTSTAAAPAATTPRSEATGTPDATTPDATPDATTRAATTPAAPATTASSAAPQGAAKIGALLATFGSGDITVKHMPTADPAWLARVQTQTIVPNSYPKVTDPKLLNLMALVDEAARERDTTALTRLCAMDCDPKVQAPLWQKPGTLAQLSSLIEKAPMGEGEVLPGFLLGRQATQFTDPEEGAFGKLVGAASPADYFAHGGIWTTFSIGTGGQNLPPEQWTGVKTVDQ